MEEEIKYDVEAVELTAKLQYVKHKYIQKIINSINNGINRKAKFKKNKLPLFINVQLKEKYTEIPLNESHTAILISEDFYSSFRAKDDVLIATKQHFSLKTT